MNHIQIAITQIGNQEVPKNSNWGESQIHMANLGIKYPKTAGVYCIKNIIDGRVYVGSSINIDKRIKNHIWNINKSTHRNIHLVDSIKKYGWDSFFFIVLEECDVVDIVSREQFWIDYYKSYVDTNGYNKQPFAYSNKNNSCPQSAKDKISKYWIGKPKTKEQNYKNSLAHMGENNANYGKPISEKLRNAIIESNKKRRLN